MSIDITSGSGKKIAHRAGAAQLTFTDSAGAPLANKEVVFRQKKHKFLFGCSEFSTLNYASGEMEGEAKAIAEKRYERVFDIFNSVTLPFYWGRFERERGVTQAQMVKNAAAFLTKNGCALKGHPLCWHTATAPWLLELSNEEIYRVQMERITRDVTDFKGIIDMWDVINEVVIMPIFDKYDNGITRICKERGRIKLVRDVFAQARAANPEATLLINDFETSESYDILIEGLLESGIKIDVIGIQSHMHQGYWGVEKTLEILERFSRFGLPLHFTENTLVSGHIMPPEIVDLNDYKVTEWPSTPEGEQRQAEEAALHYTTLFEHPLVESITWWSFNDGMWLGAPSGLVTKQSEAKPAYNALKELIKGDWWIGEARAVTDERGVATLTGIKGEYEAECAGSRVAFTIS